MKVSRHACGLVSANILYNEILSKVKGLSRMSRIGQKTSYQLVLSLAVRIEMLKIFLISIANFRTHKRINLLKDFSKKFNYLLSKSQLVHHSIVERILIDQLNNRDTSAILYAL